MIYVLKIQKKASTIFPILVLASSKFEFTGQDTHSPWSSLNKPSSHMQFVLVMEPFIAVERDGHFVQLILSLVPLLISR